MTRELISILQPLAQPMPRRQRLVACACLRALLQSEAEHALKGHGGLLITRFHRYSGFYPLSFSVLGAAFLAILLLSSIVPFAGKYKFIYGLGLIALAVFSHFVVSFEQI